MPDLQTSITTISEAELNSLFDDSVIANIDENNIELGKVKIEKDKKDNVIKVNQDTNIPFFDVSTLEEDDENEEGEDKETDEEIVAKAKLEEEKKKEEDLKKKSNSKKKEETNEEIVSPELIEVLRNTAKYYISKGFWKDFDNSEEILSTLDEEGYEELARKQHEVIIEEGHQKRKEETGDYGKAIFDYIENGGNPDEVIDLFKEQKAVENIPIDDEAGQKVLIEKFYTEVYDWSPEKAKKYINQLISSDELESEAKEVDSKYKDYFKKEVETIQLQQQATYKAEQDRQKEFAKTINNKLAERKDFTDKERKLIQEAVFRYDYTLTDGTKVNKFYQKFAEMQKNPDDYLDLVNFVMNKEGYNTKIKTKEAVKDVEKEWNFIKRNDAVAKTTGSKHEENNNDKSRVLDLDFRSTLNKYK